METVINLQPRQHKIKGKNQRQSFPVSGMTCAACAVSVESMLKSAKGVKDAGVNFATQTAWAEFDEQVTGAAALRNAVQSVGYDLIIDVENPSEVQAEMQQKHYRDVKNRTIWSAILTLPVFIIGMFFMEWIPGQWISMVLTVPVLFWFGRNFFVNAWKQARHGKANMDTLVALSTPVLLLFSLYSTRSFPTFGTAVAYTPMYITRQQWSSSLSYRWVNSWKKKRNQILLPPLKN